MALFGLISMVFLQFNGANGIIMYSTKIFKTDESLASEKNARMGTLMIGFILPIFTCCSLYTVSKFTRRTVLIGGSFIMSLCLLLFSICLYIKSQSLELTCVFAFLMAQATSQGPLGFLYFSETMTPKALALCGAANTFALIIVSYTTPFLMAWSAVSTFIGYALLNLIFGVFLLFEMKESKGKPLYEIESLYWP